jgi:hypothetical protein
MKGVMKGYEDEFNARKQNMKKLKELKMQKKEKNLLMLGHYKKRKEKKSK